MDEFDKEFIDNLAKIGGLRNILIHNYLEIDQEIIKASASQLIKDFPIFAEGVLKVLNIQEETN